MEFNEIIENHSKFKERIEWLFNFYAGTGDENTDYFRYYDHELIQPDKSYIECLSLHEPYRYTIKVKVEIYQGPNKGKILETEIYIPKLCKNGFLILTAGGELRWRSPINICLVRQLIRYFNNYNSLDLYINSDAINKISIKLDDVNPYITYTTPEGDTSKNFKLSSYLLKNGYSEYDFHNLGFSDENNTDAEWDNVIRFDISTSKNRDKINNKILQIIKRLPINENEITSDTLFDIIKIIRSNSKALEAYSPMDCDFKSQFDMIMLDLKSKRSDLYVNNAKCYQTHGEIRSRAINRAINSYFSMQSRLFNSIQTASDSNASSFLSQTNKIYFAVLDREETPFTITRKASHLGVKYTDDFVGVICPAKTPESVSGINKKNELARSAKIKDGSLYIRVLDKSMKELELELRDYYRARILSTTNWNYDEQNLIPNEDGTITILHMGVHKRVPASELNFDYLSLDSSSILSYNASMIPGANHSDSVRLSMACSELDQAIPVVGSKPPVIFTGVESEIYRVSDLNYKSDVNGEVKEVTDTYVKITTNEGKDRVIQIPAPRATINHTFTRYNTNVKVGDMVESGQVILSSDSFKSGELSLTTTLRSAFMHYKFKDEEDGFILSESATKKLAHIIDEDVTYSIANKLWFEFNYDKFIEFYSIYDRSYKKDKRINKYGLPIVGSKFYHGEIIGGLNKQITDESKSILFDLTGREKIGVKKLTVPPTIDECVVTEVVVSHKLNLVLSDENKECLNYYDKDFQSRTKVLTENSIKINSNILPLDSDIDVEIVIKLRSVNNVKMGDKLANRYGGKGTIIAIYPDEEMPRIGGPKGEIIECISSPLAPFNRKNPSQLIEHDLILVSNIIWNKHIDLIKNKEFDTIRSDLNDLFVTTRFNGYSDQDLINLHNSYDGFYRVKVSAMDTKYKPRVLLSLMRKFGTEEGVHLYLPARINDHIDDQYFLRDTKQKVQIGFSEYIRLHFLPENKAKATSDSPEDSEELVLGNGKLRQGGQSQGNMEIWAYMSHGVMDTVNEISNNEIFDSAIQQIEMQMKMLGLQLTLNNDINKESDE